MNDPHVYVSHDANSIVVEYGKVFLKVPIEHATRLNGLIAEALANWKEEYEFQALADEYERLGQQ